MASAPMAEDPLRLNCPNCGARLAYVLTIESDVHIYKCRSHGYVGVWPDGRILVIADNQPKPDPDSSV